MEAMDTTDPSMETRNYRKKKQKKDSLLSKKGRNDPNAPPPNRIQLPEMRDANRINALREGLKKASLGPSNLPSICLYTFLNSHGGVTCADICEDSSLLSAGASDSLVRIWSLKGNKIKAMKPASELEHVDKEADDVLYRMMDEKNATDMRTLIGHSGPVYSTSFSPDNNMLLSCSEDSTIRLWSLQTWSNVVCYKGHCFPVWDVKFSPFGYYFASCGHDRVVRLWTTDYYQPVRLFTGHDSDVDCVQFHPNCNYLATGSSDHTIRLWDILSGSCVKLMTGHKGTVYSLAFSTCGRFLASAGSDRKILIWDVAYGNLLEELAGHTDTIYTLSFSRDGAILSSGGLDNSIKIWNFKKLKEEINLNQSPNVKMNSDTYLLGTYRTKSTPVFTTHFTKRNLLLGAGMYQG